ncbi:DUF4231 domain-containing protein [Nocardioides sp. NPDC126508]
MQLSSGLADSDLPGFWRDADATSLDGQRWTLAYSRARLGGSLAAAFGGAVSLSIGEVDVAAIVIFIGFGVALAAELASWAHKPEREWYDGRALAESAKTLAWRYAVGADPFPAQMAAPDARELLRSRLQEVAERSGAQVVQESDHPVTTPAMESLRQQPFDVRRGAYVEGRTKDQKDWYARKAVANGRHSTCWTRTLIVVELVAVTIALARIFGGWDVDFAGILAAFIAAGAAWMAIKQFDPLAAAYTVAARELAIQADRLQGVPEAMWATTAADAEEAISREHTMWLASRTGRSALR